MNVPYLKQLTPAEFVWAEKAKFPDEDLVWPQICPISQNVIALPINASMVRHEIFCFIGGKDRRDITKSVWVRGKISLWMQNREIASIPAQTGFMDWTGAADGPSLVSMVTSRRAFYVQQPDASWNWDSLVYTPGTLFYTPNDSLASLKWNGAAFVQDSNFPSPNIELFPHPVPAQMERLTLSIMDVRGFLNIKAFLACRSYAN